MRTSDKRHLDPAKILRSGTTTFMRRATTRRCMITWRTGLKICAALVAFTLLSTVFFSTAGYVPAVRTLAAPGAFTTPVVVNDNRVNDQSVPVIVTLPNYKLLVAWQDARSGNEDIYVSTTADNGTTFTANRRADDSVGLSKQIEPAAAVSGNGTIYLTWQDNRRSTYDYDVYFSKSYDGGLTFTRNVRVDDSNGVLSWQERPSIVVTSGGTIYIAWSDDRTGTIRIRGAYSTDGGATFSPSEEVVPGTLSGQTGIALVSNANRIFAVFLDNVTGVAHPYVCASTNGGKSFTIPVRLDNTGSPGAVQRNIAIAPMPGGGIVAAWEDNRNGNWDIYSCIVSSHSVITTSDLRVDDDSTGASQLGVSVASDQLGNVYAAWADERDLLYSIRFTYLIAGESQYNSSIEVSRPGPNDMQRRPSVVSTEPGKVFVVWQDDKTGTYDVYFSSASFPILFGLPLESGWNLISIPSDGYGYRASTLGLKNGDLVTDWDSTTQKYTKTYIVGVSPPSQDFDINPSTGYWIFTGSHERINLKGNIPTAKQSKNLVVPAGGGWTVVGFESLNVTRYASDITKMLNGSAVVTTVLSYNTLTGSYKQYLPAIPPTDFVLAPGRAYWCWVTANSTLSYSP